jgi:hypothetical protein
MSAIDDFARSLLEESKRFLEKTGDGGDQTANDAYLHAALMLAFSSLEAHVNAIGDDFLSRPEVSIHEKAILLEQEVRLENGQFVIKQVPRMIRLEDRIRFLHVRFGASFDSSASHWAQLADATKLRNQLTHPKELVLISKESVGRAIQAIIDTLNALYQVIYKRTFPPASLGLHSKLTF